MELAVQVGGVRPVAEATPSVAIPAVMTTVTPTVTTNRAMFVRIDAILAKVRAINQGSNAPIPVGKSTQLRISEPDQPTATGGFIPPSPVQLRVGSVRLDDAGQSFRRRGQDGIARCWD